MPLTSPQLPLPSRYELLQIIGAGGMGTVYLVRDRRLNRRLALKHIPQASNVDLMNTDETIDFRTALTREFRTLATLRHPNIISVLDYGFDDSGGPFFTMEYLQGADTLLMAAAGQSTPLRLELIVQLLRALHYVHRRGIIHRDLKPNNILVQNSPAGPMVKLLDFGLSIPSDATQESSAGTIYYLAPEVIQWSQLSPSADLYALGVLICQMFTGDLPFPTMHIASYFQHVVSQPPNLSSPDLPPPLIPILEKLLAKTPEERYPDARSIILALNTAFGTNFQAETVATRSSFLGAAKFVGREGELAKLVSGLKQAQAGQGGGYLLGGESGVGKSRLLDEIRVEALISGAEVVRGQDIEYGENAYQAWLTAIRDLALAVPSEALSDEDLAILNLLNLDLGSLLGRELPPTPELEAKALQSRLFETVLKLLRAYPKPLLMILEDLHWAMAESLQLTDYISQHLAASRVMLIASYRSDESPHLAEKLPAAQLLRLERLGEPAVQDLVGAVLGPKFIGGDWVQTLQQQTGGNAFFLTEILRALAEEAGELEAIQAGQDIIFTDQIGKIFDRRWGALSEACRALMQGAAVAGREIDLRLLTALWPGQELEALLGEAAEYHVAEWREGAWRFEHDKLRERILGRIPPDDLRGWHARIATGLESFYQQDSLGLLLLPMIAQHWEDAGRFLNAMPYLLQLTQEAFRLASYQEALGYIARLRRGIEAIDSPPSDIARQGMDTLYLEFYAYRQLEQRQHMPGVYAAALHLAERTGLDDLYLRAYQLGADTGALSYEPQLAQTCARQMLAYTSPDSGEAFLAYYRLSQGLRAERRFAEAVTVAEEALARLSGLDSGKPWKGWNFPSTLYILAALPSFFESRQAVGWSIATTLSYCHLLQGHYDRGLESLRRSLEEIHSLPNSGRYMMSLHNLALILQSHGDVGEALSLATTLAERAPKVFPALTHTADYLKRVIEARLAGEMAQAADLLHELALLNQSEQEIEDAIFCARSAQTLFESLGQGPKIAALLDLRRALNDPLG